MQTVTFTELRNNAKKYFDAVERGEELEVYRRGKPIAVVAPVHRHDRKRWQEAHPLKLADGVSLSATILRERSESP